MKPRGPKPKPIQGRGEIRADAIYPIGVLLRRLGVSRNSLTSLRRQGLPVRHLGARCAYIDGAEMLSFLRAQNADQRSNDASGNSGNTVRLTETVPAAVPNNEKCPPGEPSPGGRERNEPR